MRGQRMINNNMAFSKKTSDKSLKQLDASLRLPEFRTATTQQLIDFLSTKSDLNGNGFTARWELDEVFKYNQNILGNNVSNDWQFFRNSLNLEGLGWNAQGLKEMATVDGNDQNISKQDIQKAYNDSSLRIDAAATEYYGQLVPTSINKFIEDIGATDLKTQDQKLEENGSPLAKWILNNQGNMRFPIKTNRPNGIGVGRFDFGTDRNKYFVEMDLSKDSLGNFLDNKNTSDNFTPDDFLTELNQADQGKSGNRDGRLSKNELEAQLKVLEKGGERSRAMFQALKATYGSWFNRKPDSTMAIDKTSISRLAGWDGDAKSITTKDIGSNLALGYMYETPSLRGVLAENQRLYGNFNYSTSAERDIFGVDRILISSIANGILKVKGKTGDDSTLPQYNSAFDWPSLFLETNSKQTQIPRSRQLQTGR